jgi:hypothetical protein
VIVEYTPKAGLFLIDRLLKLLPYLPDSQSFTFKTKLLLSIFRLLFNATKPIIYMNRCSKTAKQQSLFVKFAIFM